MRKIRIIEHISLDGVIQAPGGLGEDGPDYPHGGWIAPFRGVEGREAVIEAQGTGFDLLLGRRTYDIWAGYWPNAGDNPLANSLNNATKYVATHRPDSLAWGPVKSLGADIIAGVRGLKATDGPDLILWGSSTITTALLKHGLVDDVVLFVYPVLLGRGKRFFSDTADPRTLALVSSKAMSTGVVVNTFNYVGPIHAAPDSGMGTRGG